LGATALTIRIYLTIDKTSEKNFMSYSSKENSNDRHSSSELAEIQTKITDSFVIILLMKLITKPIYRKDLLEMAQKSFGNLA
jgi:hypothetical protein